MAKRRKASNVVELSQPKKKRGPRAKPKTKSDAPGAPGIGHNKTPQLSENEKRELFLRHRSVWNAWQAKLKQVNAAGKEIKDALKGDGFTVKQMQIADALATPDGEARVQGEVRDRLEVARFLGLSMGAQLDLFDEPDRTPIADRAFDEGKMASMEDRPARPSYAPDTEAYRAYMSGFHAHQRELAGGIKASASRPPPDVKSAHQLNDDVPL